MTPIRFLIYNSAMSHYDTLSITKSATPDEIKKAYRKLASKHHPDKGGDTATFQKIEEAYRVLSDPQQRQQYDNPNSFGPGNANGFDFNFNGHNLNDIFNQFGFGPGNPFVHRTQQSRRNKDIRAQIDITLPETLQDIQKTLSVVTSNNQRQTIDVVIPRGITSGTTMKYPNFGDNMFENLPRGDFYLNINVLPDPRFQSHGLDLITRLTIDCFQAILGSEQTVPSIDGKQFIIQTPVGCQNNTKLKIAGEGLYGFQKDIKGNLYVEINIMIPKDLNQSQLELIKTINYNVK